jgi:hypothetical protein
MRIYVEAHAYIRRGACVRSRAYTGIRIQEGRKRCRHKHEHAHMQADVHALIEPTQSCIEPS